MLRSRRFLFVSVCIGAACCPLTAQIAISSPSSSSAVAGVTSAAGTPQTVMGQVVSATSGMPIFRALVRLNDRAVLTDHDGKFEFPQYIPNARNNLQVSKPGFYSSPDSMQPGDMDLRPDQLGESIRLMLYPEALLTGTLSRPDGTPLPYISVIARRSVYNDQGHRWVPAGQIATNLHGKFRLTVPPGDYRLETQYSARDASEAVLPVIVPAGDERNASDVIKLGSGSQENFDLHPVVSRAYGVAIHIDTQPERGFPMITAKSTTGLKIPINAFGRPAGPGEMRIELPSGTYILSATQNFQDSTQYGETSVTVMDHEVSGVSLHMAPVLPIPAELVVASDAKSDKTPPDIQQLGITLESTQESTQPEGTTVGLMTVRNVSPVFRALPGTYRLQVRGMGAWYVKSASYGTTDLLERDLTVSPGASGDVIRLTVSDQTGSLHGTTSLNGAMGPCWVYLMPTGPSATAVYSTRSGTDGSFNITSLPPGSYRAIAFEQRHTANYRDPKAFENYASHLGSVTISTGGKAALDLDAVPVKEITP